MSKNESKSQRITSMAMGDRVGINRSYVKELGKTAIYNAQLTQ